ncbi:MAG: hypothetical protein AAF570_07530 [Bacteroidota bacterium]
MIRNLSVLLLLVNMSLTGCKLSDVRTPAYLKAMKASDAEEKGMALMEKMKAAHKVENLAKYETIELDFRDTWHKLAFASPFPGDVGDFNIIYDPMNYDGRMEFDGPKKKGEVWGIYDWKTWLQKEGKEAKHKKIRKVWFWVPTYQYFAMFPAKIPDATYVRYAGKKTVKGKEYEVVFASWNTDAPQKKIDQYLIYLDAATYRVGIIEYTVRGVLPNAHGHAFYEDEFEFEGIPMAKTIRVANVKGDFEEISDMHTMEILGVKGNTAKKDVLKGK